MNKTVNTQPLKELLRKYEGNLLRASNKELLKALRQANGKMEIEKSVTQAIKEYEEELNEKKKEPSNGK